MEAEWALKCSPDSVLGPVTAPTLIAIKNIYAGIRLKFKLNLSSVSVL